MYPRSQASRVWSWKANPGSWPKSELLTIRLCWLCFSRLYLFLEGHHHRRQSQLMTASSQAGPLVNRTENPPEQSSLGSWSQSLRIRRDQGPSQGGGPHCRGALGEDFGMGVARAITTVSRLSPAFVWAEIHYWVTLLLLDLSLDKLLSWIATHLNIQQAPCRAPATESTRKRSCFQWPPSFQNLQEDPSTARLVR